MPKITYLKLPAEKLKSSEISLWPIWEKEISRFDWTYDSDEECYILEGKFVVETEEGHFSFEAGDFIRFPAGLSCVWDIKEKVRKHYNFI